MGEVCMKNLILTTVILIAKICFKILYFFLKLLPTKDNKVMFCSRQSNTVPMDFVLIQEELAKRNEDIEIVCICNRLGKGLGEYIRFAKDFLRSMYHLATSRVCILDSYWPPVSLLNHKDSLKVIQIWHSIGKVKKSGYQSIGKKSGRNTNIAYLLNMHENYDHVIAGAEIFNRFYCESFNIKEDILLNYGLPRIDYLINTAEDNRNRFFAENPELKDKKIVLYTPTFRRNMEDRWHEVTEVEWPDDIALIVKIHPNQTRPDNLREQSNIYYFPQWKTADLIAVCDYLVTDYSAIALEAAVLNKKTFYWAYDYEQYASDNGVNIQLIDYVPNNVEKDLKVLIEKIKSDDFDLEAFDNYRKLFLPKELGTSTAKIVDLVEDFLK